MSLKSITKYLLILLLAGAAFIIAMPLGGLLVTLLGFQQPVMPEGTTDSGSLLHLVLESPLFAFALSLLAVGIVGRYMARALTMSRYGWCVYSLNTLSKASPSWICRPQAPHSQRLHFSCRAWHAA